MGTALDLDQATALVVGHALVEADISVYDAARRTFIPRQTLTRRLAGDSFRLSELALLAALIGTTPSAWVRQAEINLRDKAART